MRASFRDFRSNDPRPQKEVNFSAGVQCRVARGWEYCKTSQYDCEWLRYGVRLDSFLRLFTSIASSGGKLNLAALFQSFLQNVHDEVGTPPMVIMFAGTKLEHAAYDVTERSAP